MQQVMYATSRNHERCAVRAPHGSAAFMPLQRACEENAGKAGLPLLVECRSGINPALHLRRTRGLCVITLALVAVLFSFSASALEICWTNNLLTVTGTNL